MWNLLITATLSVVGFDLASCLKCIQCNERIANQDSCVHVTTDDCTQSVGANVKAVCLQQLQVFSSGQPSWVIAHCTEASQFPDFFINRECITEPIGTATGTVGEGGTLQADTITRCLCNQTDMCYVNNTSTSTMHQQHWQRANYFLYLTLVLFTVLVIFGS